MDKNDSSVSSDAGKIISISFFDNRGYSYTAKLSRMHNNSNVLAFGARVVGSELAKMIVDEWLAAEFEGGRHQRRVDMIMDIENR